MKEVLRPTVIACDIDDEMTLIITEGFDVIYENKDQKEGELMRK